MKLLGVPYLIHKSTDKSGPQVAAATKDQLDEWSCADSVTAMVFDTTASNTGRLTAGISCFYFSKNSISLKVKPCLQSIEYDTLIKCILSLYFNTNHPWEGAPVACLQTPHWRGVSHPHLECTQSRGVKEP